jgi:hypothetical protein
MIGTDEGLLDLDGGAALLPGEPITAVSGEWALVGGDRLVAIESGVEVKLDAPRAWCLLDTGDRIHVGTADARLFTLTPDAGVSAAVESFDRIPTRDEWYTPWGAPPDVRSLAAAGVDGTLIVNVHVGGVWRDAGDGWDEVIEVDNDTHQVVAVGDAVVAAAAVGFGRSLDGGRTWSWTAEGLHGSYSRAVALAGDTVLVTASTGPGSKHGAIYRRPLDGDRALVKCEAGLPDWFPFNLDTGQLAANADEAVLGTQDGRVFRSTDEGATWEPIAEDLPTVRTVTVG